MGSLPRGLEAWSEPLGLLREELTEGVGAWLQRLDALIGPLRAREALGGAMVSGVSGLTRRGDYERLLVSEWALARAVPLEFLRRAADREHLFTDLERRAPAGSQRCVLLFDAGPEQLGAPRLAHLALLIVLARRASAAKATLAWGVLQQTPATPAADADGPALERLLRLRAGRLVLPADLPGWLVHLEAPAEGDEVWVIGGSQATARLATPIRAIEIVDAPQQDGALQVRLRVAGSPPRTLELQLPTASSQRLLLTQPLRPPPSRARPSPQTQPTTSIGPIIPDLRFTLSGHRILARTPEGEPVVLNVPRQDGLAIYRRRVEHPRLGALVGLGWLQKSICLIYWQQDPNRLMVHGAVPYPQLSGSSEAYFDLDPAEPVTVHGFRRGRRPLVLRFIDRRGVLFSVDYGTRETHVLREEARGLWVQDGRCVMLSREGGRMVLRMENPVESDSPTFVLPEGGGSYQAVYSVRGRSPMGLLAFEREPGLWRTLEEDEIEVPGGAAVHGVLWRSNILPRPALLVRSASQRTLALVSASGLLALPTEEAEILTAAMCPSGDTIAWLTADSELVIWSAASKAIRSRLQLRTATDEGDAP